MLFFVFNMDLHRSGWGRGCFTLSRVCHAFFFFFPLLGGLLNEQLPSLPASSLHQTTPPHPISSCEKAQFCLSLPKRKHIMKCKPVAPPETTGLLGNCVVLNSRTASPKVQKHILKLKKKKRLDDYVCKALLLYPPQHEISHCTSLLSHSRRKWTGLIGTLTAWIQKWLTNSYTHWMYCITVFKDRMS